MTIQEAVPMVVWYKWVMLVSMILIVGVVARASATYGRTMAGFFFLAALYPLGKTIQAFELGPGFLRWYLSDVGFVPSVAVWIGFTWLTIGKSSYNGFQLGVSAGLCIALFTEWMQWVATQAGKAGASRGDFADVMLFITTASLSMMFLDRSRRTWPRSPTL